MTINTPAYDVFDWETLFRVSAKFEEKTCDQILKQSLLFNLFPNSVIHNVINILYKNECKVYIKILLRHSARVQGSIPVKVFGNFQGTPVLMSKLVKLFKVWIPTRQDWQKPDEIIELMWTTGSRMGWECTHVLAQVFMDPCITTGKAYLWTAFPRCFRSR